MLSKGKVDTKLLLKLTIPIFLELILQLLVGNVDKLMVSNAVAASAINEANTIIDMLTVSFSVLAAASLILINQYKGAQDKEKERHIYAVTFYFNLFLSIVISAIVLIFARPIFEAMNLEEIYIEQAVTYLRINGGFLFLQASMLTLSCFLRSNEFMVLSLLVSLGFNVINISLNAICIYGIGFENVIYAVAIPSVISRFIGVIVLLILSHYFVKTRLSIKSLKNFSFQQLKNLLSIGLPSVGESISYSLSQIVILAFINQIGGAAPGAKTYTYIMIQISYLFTSAISQGMQIMLGRLLGAQKKEEAHKLVMKTTIISLCVSESVALLLALASIPIFNLLVPSGPSPLVSKESIVLLCSQIMMIEIILEIGRAINIVMVRSLQTSGDVFFPTISAVIFCWIVAVVGSYILGVHFSMGMIGVWIAMSVDECLRAIIFLIRWHKGKWRRINLVNR